MPAGRHKGRQTGKLVNRQAGKNACYPARKNACRFANLKAYRQAAMLFHLRGSIWRCRGSLWRFEPYFRPGKHPTFAPKRQGKAESAYRRPRLRPSFGQQKVSGDRCLAGSVTTGLSPIRSPRILCPLRHSSKVSFELLKGFRVTPETTLPLTGRASSPKSGSLFLPAVRMLKAAPMP